ncbi:MAG: hypothetical protein R3300_00570 [Candidatus Promineifilaceae bacterium]|nr:hypothetical protein [Candidatus Promineifilaceae bacterium]
MKGKVLFLALIAIALVLAGCAQLGAADTEGSACPEPGQGTALLTNETSGYCFLYPDRYLVEARDNADILVIDSIMNHIDPRADIQVEDANGRTAADAADEMTGGFSAEMGLERSTVTLGGEEAVVIDNYPGQEISRLVFVVHGDRLYRLSVTHTSSDLGDTYTQAENLYTVIINSFGFLPQ